MLFEKLANKSPETLILNTWKSLRTTYNLIPENTCFDGFTQGLRDGIKKGEISEALLDDQWLVHIATDQMNPTYPFIYACLLNEIAQQTLDSGDLNKSWPLIVQASTKAEVAAVHAFYNSEIDIHAALNHRRASTASNASNSKLQPAKDYAVTLMREKRPKHGWLDLKHAAQSIENELGDFIDRERISLSKNLLVNTLKRWHKTDEQFRDLVNEIIA
ncbi:hypothetical protein [Pseudomonas chlororaphis]|uniref:hypothetical protein n=1 Tax=Pseudomonas chlororaphis TaxID=587753 RepID=UPI0018E94B4F|nr:hypothetical protein [Pseudomonas chlororaphis]